MNCVFRKFVQKSFRQKIPRDLRLLLSVVKAGRCAFLSTDFSRDLLSHSFVRFLSELCVCDIGSCFVLSKWVDGAVLDMGENLKGICGQGLGHFCLRIFHDFACSQLFAIFVWILRLRHWFLLCFGHVGRWGCMRYGRNDEGIVEEDAFFQRFC